MDNVINLIKYAFLGLLQGITEPIPVSSSGHLVIAERLFGIRAEGLGFEVLVNFASLLAILVIYRADLTRLIVHGWKFITTRKTEYQADFQLILFLILATIPAAVFGLLLKDFIAEHLKGMVTIGITLLITSAALWVIRNLRGSKSEKGLKAKDALIVGLAQTVALIPGISRSGATIVAAMGLGMKQETSLRFSFFLYIPVSLGSMVLEGPALLKSPEISTLGFPYLIAFICSLVASYFSLKWFMGVMARGHLKWFSIYCLFAGTCVLIFL